MRLPQRYCAAAFVLLLSCPLLVTWRGQLYDVALYHRWAAAMGSGALPYADFQFEYPPIVALLLFVPYLLAQSLTGYAIVYRLWMGLLDMAQKLRLWRSHAHPWLFLTVFAVLELPLYTTCLKRFDVAAAAAVSFAIAALVARPLGTSAWLYLGTGIAIKLYPVVLLAPFVLFAWRQSKQAWPILRGILLCAAVPVAWQLAAVFVAGAQASQWLYYHAERGLHLASSYVAVHVLQHGIGRGFSGDVASRFGALQIISAWGDAYAVAAPLYSAAALLVVYAIAVFRLRSAHDLYRTALAAVACILLLSKVASPQFMLWLVPLATLSACQVNGRCDWPLLLAMLCVNICTGALFPGEWRIGGGFAHVQLALLGRTFGLVALIWAAVRGLSPAVAPWRSARLTDPGKTVTIA